MGITASLATPEAGANTTRSSAAGPEVSPADRGDVASRKARARGRIGLSLDDAQSSALPIDLHLGTRPAMMAAFLRFARHCEAEAESNRKHQVQEDADRIALADDLAPVPRDELVTYFLAPCSDSRSGQASAVARRQSASGNILSPDERRERDSIRPAPTGLYRTLYDLSPRRSPDCA